MTANEKLLLDELLWAERVLKKYTTLYNNIIEFNLIFINIKFKQKIYNYYHDIKIIPKCEVCKGDVKFHNSKYNTYCSISCSNSDIVKINKMRETLENTMLSKYGVKSPFKIPGIKESISQKNIEKWGFDIPSKSEEIKEKISKTKLSKNSEENSIINNKRRETNLDRWGVDNVAKLDDIKNKTIETNLDRWGVEYPIQLEFFKNKRKNNFYNKHGVNHHFNIESILENMQSNRKATLSENYLSKVYNMGLKVINYKDKFIEIECSTCNNNYKIPVYLLYQRYNNNMEICTNCNPLNNKTSSYEIEILNFLTANNINNIESSNRSILDGKELDIYIPFHKLAIEFNGLYWHSEIYLDNKYHLNKTDNCRNKGIDLIHIFEDDWLYKQDIIKSILKNRLGIINNKIYSRKCEIREVKSNLTRVFLNENHIQGFAKSKYKLGLYYNNELVSLMTFGYRMINSKKEFELIRFCNKLDTVVIGAASKLFKHFVNSYGYNSIISYADVSMFGGGLYKTLGFDFIHRTKTNYYWVIGGVRKHRFNYNKKKLIKEGYDPSMTEVEIMHNRGYYRIWGCGQDKYIYTK